MQESLVVSSPLMNGNLQTEINAVLAQTVAGKTNWKIATSFSGDGMAFVVFVREPLPPSSSSSPYVVT